MSDVQYAIAILKEKLGNADKHNLQYQRFSISDMEAIWGVLAKCEKDYAALKAQRDALAAENVALKSVVEPIANLAQYPDIVAEMSEALRPHEVDGFVSVFSRARYLPPTPATDAYLNSVRAEGAIAVRDALVLADDGSDIYEVATQTAAQLRAGEPS